jgi:hypothetical protein
MSQSEHGDAPRPAARPRHKRRIHYPNLSPSRPPHVEADLALWPAWTNIPVEELDWEAFEVLGYPRAGGP